jgi:uncharacterized protein
MVHHMKIRTITAGCNFSESSRSSNIKQIRHIIKDAKEIKQYFNKHGYTVQTIRLSTPPWECYASTKKDLFELCSFLQSLCPESVDYFNVGPISTVDHISWLFDLLENYPQGFCTINLVRQNRVQKTLAWETAQLIKKVSAIEKQGFANLRFAALCNVEANTPFYPASFHDGNPSFGIGCENSDLIYSTFSNVDSYEEAFDLLKKELTTEYQKIEQIAQKACKDTALSFHGIDPSISPSVNPNESLVYGIEQLPFVNLFGDPGTLTAARLITSVLQELPINNCGYSGLMLPVMEDSGLAKRNKEGKLSLTKLLFYSSVCGTGLDTIPLPGDVSVETLYGILLDVATLSTKLQKPLSARLMPIPTKKAGDETEFAFEYFENTIVMNP